jgi:hypothetical protein
MQIIPTTNAGARRITLDLGGDIGTHTFRTYYNYLAGMWFLDLLDVSDVAILNGLALVPFIDVLRAHTDIDPVGQLRVADTAGTGNATPESLGTAAQLLHYAPGEFDTLFPDDVDRLPDLLVAIADVLIT